VVCDDLHELVEEYSHNMSSANAYIEERKNSMMATLDANITATNEAGPGGYCTPRHPTYCESSFLEPNGTV
jgi:hypothetical protein